MPSMTMRDTSRDYRTYWIRDGLYYGKSTNLGGGSACVLPPDKVAQIPEPDRSMVLDEVTGNPTLCAWIVRIMKSDPDWTHRISQSAKESVVNEMDPSKFQESRGEWPKLRAKVRELLDHVHENVLKEVSGMTLDQKMSVVRRIASGGKVSVPSVHGLGDLGQWDVIGSLVGSLVSAGAGAYGAYTTTSAQQDIAKLQASSAMQSANAQIAIANANAAIAGAQAQIANPISSAVSSLTSATVAGIPIIVPVLGVIGVGLWLAFGRK
jgi:hypothetical protein